ncbi:MAG: M1 family metallopeptidase [Chloroflexi bacterium]|nr:M1 family metallopeptidase [Chloroflexota bacterium]
MMHRILLVSFILFSLLGTAHAQDGGHFSPAMQPEFQQDIAALPNIPQITLAATLVITEQQASISGNLEVIYTNTSTDTLNEMVFRLYPNYPSYGGQAAISNAQINGTAVTPALDSTASIVSLPLTTPLAPTEQVAVSMDFTSTVFAERAVLYAQYSYLGGNLALPNFFPLLSVYETGLGWWRNIAHPQGDAVYSATADFDVTLTAPANWVLITSGTQIESTDNADQTRTAHYVAPLMRDFALIASPNYQTVNGEQDGISIDVHYFSGGDDAANTTLRFAEEAVRIYNANFGEYPFAELDIVETRTTAGGIEYPGLVVVQSESWNSQELYLEIVTAHEVAHQWWYSLVGNDQTRDPWLDESLAQYSTALYFGEVHGADFEQGFFDSYTDSWQNFRNEHGDMVIGLSPSDYPDGAYFSFVYAKGPLFFKLLADTYGQDALIQALHAYFAAYRYQIATPAALQTVLEQSLSQDLDSLFLEWVGQTN